MHKCIYCKVEKPLSQMMTYTACLACMSDVPLATEVKPTEWAFNPKTGEVAVTF